MAKVIVKVRVAYPRNLIQQVQAQEQIRKLHGELSSSFCALADDLNVMFCIFDWQSVESAKKFWSLDIAKAQVAEWRAVGGAELCYLEDALEVEGSDPRGLVRKAFAVAGILLVLSGIVFGHAHEPDVRLRVPNPQVFQMPTTTISTSASTITNPDFTAVTGKGVGKS